MVWMTNSILFPYWQQLLQNYNNSLSSSFSSSSSSSSLFATTFPKRNPLSSLDFSSVPRSLWLRHTKQPSSSLLTALAVSFLYTYTPRGEYSELFGYLIGYCARAHQWTACRTILSVMKKVVSTSSNLFSEL